MNKILLPAILLVVGLALGLGGVVAAAQLTGGSIVIGKAPDGGGKAADPKDPKTAHAAKQLGIMYATKDRVVNLADTGTMRYLKATVFLEIADPHLKELPKGEEYKKKQEELAKEMKGHQPIIEDVITSTLSAKTVAEVLPSDARQKVRDELKEKLNKALGHEMVLSVYFTEFVVQ